MAPKPVKKSDMEPPATPVHDAGSKRKANATPGRGMSKVSKRDTDDEDISDADITGTSMVTMDVLKAVICEALQPMVSELASIRSDISELKSVKEDVADLKSQIGSIESSIMAKVESKLDDRISSSLAGKLDRLAKEHEMLLSKRQAMIFNLPNATNRQALRDFTDKIGKGILSMRIFTTKAKRTMASVRFSDQQARDAFVASFKQTERVFSQDNQKYTLVAKNDQPESVRKRNGAIHSKVKELKDSGKKNVEIDWKSRTITIEGAPVFCQKPASDDIVPIQ